MSSFARKNARRKKISRGTTEIDGVVVLDGEVGRKFYHKHMSPKAKGKKKARRQLRKQSRKR